MIQLTNGFYAFPVPEGSRNHHIETWYMMDGEQYIAYKLKDDLLADEYTQIDLPKTAQWEIIGKADSITEEQAAEIVGAVDNGGTLPEAYGGDYIENIHYYDYLRNVFAYRTALESFASLLSSKGLNPETTVILKQS